MSYYRYHSNMLCLANSL